MKKSKLTRFLAITCALVTLISSTTNSLAVNPIGQTKADTLESYKITQRQRDILMSLGVKENEVDSLTPKEIGKLLANGQIVNYNYISKYLPTPQEMQADFDNYQKQVKRIVQKFPEANLNSEEVEHILKSSKMSPDDFLSLSQPQVSNIAQKSLVAQRVAIDTTKYTYFERGTNKLKYYAFSSCNIHRNTLSTVYARNATSAHYKEMNNNVACARAIGNILFDKTIPIKSTSQYSYGLWGDFYTSAGGAHQGIDYTLGEGTDVYAVAPGNVVAVEYYRGGYTVTVENTTHGIRYIYMHLKNIPSAIKVGKYISGRTQIGEQGRYTYGKDDNSHVHFEVTTDLTRTQGHPNETNNVYSANPYVAGLYFAN